MQERVKPVSPRTARVTTKLAMATVLTALAFTTAPGAVVIWILGAAQLYFVPAEILVPILFVEVFVGSLLFFIIGPKFIGRPRHI